MNSLVDQPTDEITIRFIFVGEESFIQTLPIDESDGVQDLLDWYRDNKAVPIWTWSVPSVQKVHMLNKAHIIGIDIDGYIEPEGKDSKWYEKLLDKIKTKWMMQKIAPK